MRVDYCELYCDGGQGVGADGDHMIRRGGIHVALQLEPDVMGGPSEGGDIEALPNTTAQRTIISTVTTRIVCVYTQHNASIEYHTLHRCYHLFGYL